MHSYAFPCLVALLLWLGSGYAQVPTEHSVQVAPQEQRDKALKPGDVFIPREYRVRNSNGNCVWCAVETVCWGGAGLESFRGIKSRAVQTGWRGAGMGNVEAALKAAAVPYEATRSRDYSVLYRSVEYGSGAYIETDGHALVLVGIDDQSVRVIDNNGSGEVQSWSRHTFNGRWNGCALFPRLFLRRHPVAPRPSQPFPPLNPDPVFDQRAVLAAIAALQKQVEAIKPVPGPPGPRGPEGPPGPAADFGAQLAELQKQMAEVRALLPKQQRVRVVPAEK